MEFKDPRDMEEIIQNSRMCVVSLAKFTSFYYRVSDLLLRNISREKHESC